MEYKDAAAELKALDDAGEGVLRFIRFHQQDKDADITLPGFVGQQEAVLLASHNWRSDFPPLGKGASYEADGATYFRFQLNMDDERAKSWRSWLKMGGSLQQVSYGFSPYSDAVELWQKNGQSGRFLKPRPDGSPGAKLHEVSFVTVGSGNDQGILAVKAANGSALQDPPPMEIPFTPPEVSKRLVSPHQTATVDLLWNPYLHRARVKASGEPFYFAGGFLVGAGDDFTQAKSWLGLHHEVKEDGSFGAANLWAIEALEYYLHLGLFPDAWREPMWNHLAKHKQDAGVEQTRLGPPDSYTYPLIKREQFMLCLAKGMMQERLDIQDIKSAKGHTVTESHRHAMQEHRDTLVRHCEILAIAPTLALNDAAIQELNGREYAHSLHARVEAGLEAEQKQKAEAEKALGDELYQRYLARQQRMQHVD